MSKSFKLRLNDSQHKTLSAKAKKAGLSMNDFLLNKIEKDDDKQAIINALTVNQNRAFDSLLIQISEQKLALTKQNIFSNEGLTATQFYEFQRQFLGLFSILSGGLKLDNLQQKVNYLQDSLTKK